METHIYTSDKYVLSNNALRAHAILTNTQFKVVWWIQPEHFTISLEKEKVNTGIRLVPLG